MTRMRQRKIFALAPVLQEITMRKIIVLEGTEAVGKTSVSHVLQRLLPNHMYLKLSQPNGLKGDDRFYTLLRTFKYSLDLLGVAYTNNAILDRYTMSERVYGPLYHGFTPKQYRAFDAIELLLQTYRGHQILLTAERDTIRERLIQKAAQFPNEKHLNLDNVLRVQERYLEVAKSHSAIPTLIIPTDDRTPFEVAAEILDKVGLEELKAS